MVVVNLIVIFLTVLCAKAAEAAECSKTEFNCEGTKLARCVHGKSVVIDCSPGTTCSLLNGAGFCVAETGTGAGGNSLLQGASNQTSTVATGSGSSSSPSTQVPSSSPSANNDELEDCKDEPEDASKSANGGNKGGRERALSGPPVAEEEEDC